MRKSFIFKNGNLDVYIGYKTGQSIKYWFEWSKNYKICWFIICGRTFGFDYGLPF